MEMVFHHAFSIMLHEVKENLENGMKDYWAILTRNGLHHAVGVNSSPDPKELVQEIITLLKVSIREVQRHMLLSTR